jgi:hypothetical protein
MNLQICKSATNLGQQIAIPQIAKNLGPQIANPQIATHAEGPKMQQIL